MYHLSIEYGGNTTKVVLFDGIDVGEFTEMIKTTLDINDPIIAIMTPDGTLLPLKCVCKNPSELQSGTHTVIVKPQNSAKPIEPNTKPNRFKATQSPQPQNENISELLSYLKFARMQGNITEEEEKIINDLAKNHDQSIVNAYKNMCATNDVTTFINKIKQRCNFLNQTYVMERRPISSLTSSRQVSRVKQDEGASINWSQAMMLGVVHDLEVQNKLEKHIVIQIKTLILEENKDVIKVMNQYFAHFIEEKELSFALARISGTLETYIERPMSPLPKKDTIMNYLNFFAVNYIKEKEDISLLVKLVEDENEFVMAAFDVFESDMDNENILDTLKRVVKKYKRMGLSKNSVKAGGFYGEDLLEDKPNNESEENSYENEKVALPLEEKKKQKNKSNHKSKQKAQEENHKEPPILCEEFQNHDKVFEVKWL